MIDLLIASVIQGVTEFIPVSSSLHLIIFDRFFSIKYLSLLIIAAMHMGSVIALIFFLYFDTGSKLNIYKNEKFIKSILISSIPIFIFGYIFYDLIENFDRLNILIIFTTIFFGLVLFFSDYFSSAGRTLQNIGWLDSIVLGFSQCLSLVPGVSRSASVIIASRFLKIDRESSIIYSLLLSIPVILAAFCFALYKIDIDAIFLNKIWIDIICSLFFSSVSSYITLRVFFKFSSSRGFGIFAFYRVILGLFLLFQL
jgi:undecaprenyl-diphosphatase